MATSKAKTALLVVLGFSTGFACAYAIQVLRAAPVGNGFEAKPLALRETPAPVAPPKDETPSPAVSTDEPEAMPSTAPAPAKPSNARTARKTPGGPFNSPPFARALALQQRAGLDARYASLFRQLKLSPEALAKFKDLLIERQSTMRDVMTSARAQGLTPDENPAAFKALIGEANAEIDAALQALLTPEQLQTYRDYAATLPQQNLLSQFNTRLSYSTSPLTESQTAALRQLLTAGTATVSNFNGFGGRAADRAAPVTDQVLQQASTFLNADQVAALKEIQEEQKAQRDLRRPQGGQP